MKKIILTVAIIVTNLCSLIAQTNIPNSINLQAIARNTSGTIVQSAPIQVRLSFYPSALPSTMLVQKVYTTNTDDFGQFQVNVDNGGTTVAGSVANLSNIDWSAGNIQILLEYQDVIGPIYTVIDTVKAGATFYAFASRTAEELKTPATASGQVLKYNGTAWAAGTDDNTTYTAGNGLQLTGTTFSADDPSNTNEAQTLSLVGSTLTLSQANGAGGGTATIDPSSTNELPTAGAGISVSGNTVTNTGDTDASNDITNTTNASGDVSGTFSNLTIDNNTIGTNQIINGTITASDIASGVIPTAGAGITINGSNQIVATDPSITNELPTAGTGISVTGNNVSSIAANSYAVYQEIIPHGSFPPASELVTGWVDIPLATAATPPTSSDINVAGSVITLNVGTYKISGFAHTAVNVDVGGGTVDFMTKIINISNGTMAIMGNGTHFYGIGIDNTMTSQIAGIITVNSNNTLFKFQKQFIETGATTNYGTQWGVYPEDLVLSQLMIERIK